MGGCNANREFKGVLRGTNFSISSEEDLGLVQQFQLQFQRRLSRVYNLAEPDYYYLEGPAEGQVTFSQIVGPSGCPGMNCDCEPEDITLDAGGVLCDQQTNCAYTLVDALQSGITGQGDAQNFLIVFGAQYIFSDLITA